MRILHVLDHSLPLHSGYTFRTLAILNQQRALGWQTFHVTSPKQGNGEVREEQIDEWSFFRTPPVGGLTGRLPLLRHRGLMGALRRRLAEVVDQVRPDIIHAHSPVLNAIPALSVGREKGIPVVYEVRAFWEDAAADHGTAAEWGLRYRLTRALETRALRRADAVTTICEGLRKDMLGRGLAADRITVIPNAVDVSTFAFQERADATLQQHYGLTPGKTLGFAGSFYAYEGLDLLLRAMPEVLRNDPQIRLMLVGGGPQEASLKALRDELGLEHAVHFTGRVPHAEVGRYYSVMDVMVYPRVSRRLTDLVTPLKPLEAMAMGKLVAASDVGGHRELINDGGNGHLFKADSAQALAARILQLMKRPDAWSEVIANGRAFVERERTWRASVARYRDVYAGVLGKRATVETR
ncbi:glycosyltransferase, exosortase A system-associated [Oleiagrimonas sp. C23AA]|nr:glycosyltransferase, exosortase A system-associated [Oleiagrimonas sp. C23AA]